MNIHDPSAAAAAQLASAIQDGDAVLDFAGVDLAKLAATSGVSFSAVAERDNTLQLVEVSSAEASSAISTPRAALCVEQAETLIAEFKTRNVRRLLAASAANSCGKQKQFCDAVAAAGIEVVVIELPAARSGADDFMPAEDSETVAARLRELGYI